MARKNLRQITRLLRHNPHSALAMDPAGWVRISDVLTAVGASDEELREFIAADNKERFTIRGEFIRAAQGHSAIEVDPVALEASWAPSDAEVIFHGTNWSALNDIRVDGWIRPQSRTHVHSAAAMDSRTGRRTNIDVFLVIDTAELDVWESENGVLLTREIPFSAVKEIVPVR